MAAVPPAPGETQGTLDPRRKTLAAAVAGILQEAGFLAFEKAALGTLTEMLQSCECRAAQVTLTVMHCCCSDTGEGTARLGTTA
ncbi:hypothetical protein E2C01_077365 [Portunus trituberculatus]|uniref:Bromodomain associated domain-containing protein n=1 Tax=Portunus trituberculatus TaxID=210409 RepID=A0A5B7IR52_PORTR|nr:hypothetical protein [Portunus trituberculatus]